MPITPSQARAARALLDLKQHEVAVRTKVTQTGLSLFEKSENPETKSGKIAHAVEKFFNQMGLEFGERDMIRRKSTGLHILKGHEGFKEFIYDVYETMKNGGNICVTNVDERQFERWQGMHSKDYLSKMATIPNLSFKILVQEGDDYFTASEYAQYRFLPTKHFSGVPTYVYGSKKADILFEDNDVLIIVTDNERLSSAERKAFDLVWENALEPI